MFRTTIATATAALIGLAITAPAHASLTNNGVELNGIRLNSLTNNGISLQGRSTQGTAFGAASVAIDGIELPAALR